MSKIVLNCVTSFTDDLLAELCDWVHFTSDKKIEQNAFFHSIEFPKKNPKLGFRVRRVDVVIDHF